MGDILYLPRLCLLLLEEHCSRSIHHGDSLRLRFLKSQNHIFANNGISLVHPYNPFLDLSISFYL
jgi:hypothetical protein